MYAKSFTTDGGRVQTLYDLFTGDRNTTHLLQNVGNGVRPLKQIILKFAADLKIDTDDYDASTGNIDESLQYLNQLFLNKYGSAKDETHTRTYGKYPSVKLNGAFNYTDVTAFRNLDVQFDQKTFRDNSRFRYKNVIKPWQKAGAVNRHYTENTGLRLGTFQEKHSINRGYDMSGIMSVNRYNTKPEYVFDTLL